MMIDRDAEPKCSTAILFQEKISQVRRVYQLPSDVCTCFTSWSEWSDRCYYIFTFVVAFVFFALHVFG